MQEIVDVFLQHYFQMPIKVPDFLPAKEILRKENIFVMNESRAFSQDIRPLKIIILNLMPNKQETEVQLLRLLGNSPLQLDITLLHMGSHIPKNTSLEYLETFYKIFDEIKDKKFDGMVITGAPIEHLQFEQVTYWKELCQIMEWSNKNVYSTFHICWSAQAALYYHYDINKYMLPEKVFGIFEHKKMIDQNSINIKLLRGFDETFFVPHSRYTEIRKSDIDRLEEIELLSISEEAGVYLAASLDRRKIFATGHSEYDQFTLKNEYERDIAKGHKIAIPKNYFYNDDPTQSPIVKWRAHSNLLFSNWLNYYVYQETPFDLDSLKNA